MLGCPRRAPAAVALAWLLAGALTACQIEDRTPSGTRRDDAAIQSVLAGYHRALAGRDWSTASAYVWRGATYGGIAAPGEIGPGNRIEPMDSALAALARAAAEAPTRFDVRLVRADVRQEGDLAAAWVTTRRQLSEAGRIVDEDWLEHIVLRRMGGAWRILSIAHADRTKGTR